MARNKGIRYPKGYPKPVRRLYPNGWPGNLRAVLYLNNRHRKLGLQPDTFLNEQTEMSNYG